MPSAGTLVLPLLHSYLIVISLTGKFRQIPSVSTFSFQSISLIAIYSIFFLIRYLCLNYFFLFDIIKTCFHYIPPFCLALADHKYYALLSSFALGAPLLSVSG